MNDIIAYDPDQHNVVVQRNQALIELRDKVFQIGLHYGEPFKGSGKPTLLKPGAELILARFKLWPDFVDRGSMERWDADAPLFHYRYECKLTHRDTGQVWGAGIGSCNSMEDKYRWRNQERACPNCGAENIRKSKTKDEWYCWQKTGGCGATFPGNSPAIMDQPLGKVPNTEVFTLVNTFDKMAQKRALVAAVLNATGASTFFTQDVEDFPGYAGQIIDASDVQIIDGDIGEVIEHAPEPAPAPQPAAPAKRTKTPAPVLDEVFGRDVEREAGVDGVVNDAPDFATDERTFDQTTLAEVKLALATSDMADNPNHAGNLIAKAMKQQHGAEGWSAIFGEFTVSAIWRACQAYRAENPKS